MTIISPSVLQIKVTFVYIGIRLDDSEIKLLHVLSLNGFIVDVLGGL